MFLYFGLIFFVTICVVVYDVLRCREGNRIAYILICIYIIALSGFRYKIGGDTINYMANFDFVPYLTEISLANVYSDYNVQPLFLILSSFAKTISQDFTTLQILHAFLLNVVLFYWIKKTTVYVYTAVLLYVLWFFTTFNFEVMRESLAVVFFLLGFRCLQDGKFFCYYFWLFIAFLFHLSALAFVFLPLLRNIRLNKTYVALFVVVLFLAWKVIVYLDMITAVAILKDTTAGKVDSYMNEIHKFSYGWVLVKILQFAFVPAFILSLYRKIISSYRLEYVFCISIIFGVLSIWYGIIFGRLMNYFLPVIAVCLTNVIGKICYNNKMIKVGSCIMTVFIVLAPYWWYNYMTTKAQWDRYYPYTSIFSDKLDKDVRDSWENSVYSSFR